MEETTMALTEALTGR